MFPATILPRDAGNHLDLRLPNSLRLFRPLDYDEGMVENEPSGLRDYSAGMVQLCRLVVLMFVGAWLGLQICGNLFYSLDGWEDHRRWQLNGALAGAICGLKCELWLRPSTKRSFLKYSLWEMLVATALIALILGVAVQ